MTAKKRLFIYLGVTFALTWALEIIFIIPKALDPNAGLTTVTLLTTTAMLIPALGSIITRLITKEGFSNMWLRPRIKGAIGYYAIAWFAPAILTLLGAAVYFLVYPDTFDSSLSYMKDLLAQSGVAADDTQVLTVTIFQLFQSALIAPILNIVFCMGEELGWRGYMMPKFNESGVKVLPSLLIGGVIWGLWHAPLTYVGHNYGMDYAGWPWLGILMMCLFCVSNGVIFTFITYKTHSCLAAALAHGALNGFASAAALFTLPTAPARPLIGPMPTGLLGGIPLYLTAAVLAFVMWRDEKNGKLIMPAPARKAPAPVQKPAVDPSSYDE